MLFCEETANRLHHKLSHIEKPPFCSCACAYHTLRALIMHKILCGKDTQCKTEESPLVNSQT